MRMRVSRPRKDFGHDGGNYIERDAGESNMEIKVTKTGYFTKKRVLEIGLQAANQMKVKQLYIYFEYRGSHLRRTTTEWLMLACNMTLKTLYRRCRNFPKLIKQWLKDWKSLSIGCHIE